MRPVSYLDQIVHNTLARRSLSPRLILAAIVAACSSADRVTAPLTKPEFAISDAVHEGGTPGFYFLPPVVRQPTFGGTFDAGQLGNLRVYVCDLTSGGCPIEFPSTAIKLAPADQQYQVNWNTTGLTAGHLYELAVATRAHPQTLGWVDVLLTDRSGTVPALNDVYITQAGRTTPIKFRIEQGAVTTPPPVASVMVTPATSVVLLGTTVQLSAATLDAAGNLLTDRTVSWASSDPTIATVSATGLVTGAAVGGPIIITATSEGQSGQASVTVGQFVITGIHGIQSFLEHCPTTDPAYAQIRQDFELLADGQPDLSPITCTEPISALPIDQLTDELIAVQVLRTAYYMSMGTEGRLPWTPKSLYAWMASSVNGIDLKTAATTFSCCEFMNGKVYFVAPRQDAFNRDFKRTWNSSGSGISGSLGVYVHEIRHLTGPGHVTGCNDFPLPTDPLGCDATYDLTNLGSFGVQYWLESSWATGYLDIGIGCSPFATAMAYATADADAANAYRDRFVTNVPPVVTAPQPYGGPCV